MAILRLAAAVAALLLALLSQGDALVVAAALAVASWRPVPVVALSAALVASSWRWGSSSLEALAGGQAALGPAGWVGPGAAAASSWLAALAVVLVATRPVADLRRLDGRGRGRAMHLSDAELAAALDATAAGPSGAIPNRRQVIEDPARGGRPSRWVPDVDALGGAVLVVAAGAAGAGIVAGPAPGGDLWIRIVAVPAGVALAALVATTRHRRPAAGFLLDLVGVVAGAGALGLGALDAAGWSGTVSTSAIGEGVAIGCAAAAPVAVVVVAATTRGRRGVAAMGARRA